MINDDWYYSSTTNFLFELPKLTPTRDLSSALHANVTMKMHGTFWNADMQTDVGNLHP